MSILDDTYQALAENLQQDFSNANDVRSKFVALVRARRFGEDIGYVASKDDITKLADAFAAAEIRLEFLQGVSASFEEADPDVETRATVDQMLGKLSGIGLKHN